MRIAPTDEQRLLRDSLRRLLPGLAAPAGKATGPGDGLSGRNSDRWRRLADLGVPGAGLPSEVGGLDGGPEEQAVIMEEAGRFLLPEPIGPVLASAEVVRACGRAGEALLADVAAGEARLVLVAGDTVPGGIVASGPRNGGWRLAGAAAAVVGAPAASAFVVAARLADGSNGLFLVPREEPGCVLRAFRTFDGRVAADLRLDDVAVGPDALLCGGPTADAALAAGRDLALVLLGAEALGICEAVLDLTADYVRARQQFGQPIGAFQVVQHRLADMYVETDRLRSSVTGGLAGLGSGPAARRRAAAAVKVVAGRSGQYVAGQGVQLHGGMGMADEHVVGQYLKRMTAIEMTAGSSEHHLQRIAADIK